MNTEQVAVMLKALGDPNRLRIYQFLRECMCDVSLDHEGQAACVGGPTAGQVCCSVFGLDRVTSTMSFHLKELRQAGLIKMQREGQRMVCSIEVEALKELGHYFASTPTSCSGGTNEQCCE